MMTQSFSPLNHMFDASLIEGVLSQLPAEYAEPVVKHYASLLGRSPSNKSRVKGAVYLHGLNNNRVAGQSRILLQDRETIRRKADRLAMDATKRVYSGGYAAALQLLKARQISEPVSVDGEEAGKVARVVCADWWKRQLTKQSERDCEHFAIKSGFVRRNLSPYISKALMKHIEAKQKSSLESLERMEAVNTDTGEVIDMVSILKGSTANPEVRRIELMVRCRGFEEYAEHQGHIAAFYTITAPSKYHATAWNAVAKKAYDNRKYSGVTPRDTQAYLVNVWARIRSKLKRDGLNVYGFRVCEPHHDGTPHWHLLLFVNPEQQQVVTEVMRGYALTEDGKEHGAAKHRFTVELIDAGKGSATGYIAKYIAKNINGAGIGEDYESGMDASLSADRVRAWASLWGIRQFQQIGGAPVGVWRELRRVTECPDGLLDEAMKAADSGDWMQYLILQGGADSDRKSQPIRCYTVERINTETGEAYTNKYGELVDKVEGVVAAWDSVETRIHEWVIQRKKTEAELEIPEQSKAEMFFMTENSIAFDLEGAAARSSVNNCTNDCEVSL